jgi:hypothetical protein
MAVILEVPIGTVKSRISRGVAQLRKMMLSDGVVSERDHAARDLSATLLREPLGNC